MSYRQSCERCRQQKVKCLRDETQRKDNNSSSSNRNRLPRCERCTKAGVDCVYNISPTAVKQRSNLRSVQTSAGKDNEPRNLNSPSWFEQGLAGTLYTGGPSLGADFANLAGQFPDLDRNGILAGFNNWDGNLQPFSPTSLNYLEAQPTADVALLPTALSHTDSREENEDVDDEKDPTDTLSSQLTSLSQNVIRAMRRLVRPGRAPLTVSSPEVTEALEDTNILVNIINNITAKDPHNVTLDPTTTNHGLAFSALACHQHLVALFRAICEAIHRCLQSGGDRQQPHQQRSDVGPSSVAQFVMVLQLLMHLINRIDRSLFQNTPSMWHSAETSSENSPIIANFRAITTTNPMQSEAVAGSSSSRSDFLIFVQNTMGSIPDEHQSLREVIQKLQMKMESPEVR